MYNLVHVFPQIRSLTCWEPMFDIADLAYLPLLKQITLIRCLLLILTYVHLHLHLYLLLHLLLHL